MLVCHTTHCKAFQGSTVKSCRLWEFCARLLETLDKLKMTPEATRPSVMSGSGINSEFEYAQAAEI
jgi:hypothetical protein